MTDWRTDRQDLWRILVAITNDRVIDARRKKHPLTESAFGVNSDDSDGTSAIARVANNTPTPEMGYATAENLRALIVRMDRRHPDLKQIAAWRLESDRVQQIADKLDTPKRNIERRLAWIEEIWNEYREELD